MVATIFLSLRSIVSEAILRLKKCIRCDIIPDVFKNKKEVAKDASLIF